MLEWLIKSYYYSPKLLVRFVKTEYEKRKYVSVRFSVNVQPTLPLVVWIFEHKTTNNNSLKNTSNVILESLTSNRLQIERLSMLRLSALQQVKVSFPYQLQLYKEMNNFQLFLIDLKVSQQILNGFFWDLLKILFAPTLHTTFTMTKGRDIWVPVAKSALIFKPPL